MQLTFLGVRGSVPVPDPRMQQIGGNTASIMVEKEGHVAFLDAGTGIINGGKLLLRKKKKDSLIHIFLTHLHIDHIQGLPFFPPIYDPAFTIRFYCPLDKSVSLRCSIESLFLPPYSPVTLNGIKAGVDFIQLDPQREHALSIAGGIQVRYRWHRHHPLLGAAFYRLTSGGRSVVYATDIESPDGLDPELADFARGADVLIHDSQYLDRDYYSKGESRRGFGHSPLSAALAGAQTCGAKRLFLFHFDPEYSDAVVTGMLRRARKSFKRTWLAREFLKINLRS